MERNKISIRKKSEWKETEGSNLKIALYVLCVKRE